LRNLREGIMDLVYRIPICGGFCAPTISPETSWLRHVSNEFTLPGGPLFAKVGRLVESNPFCVRLGALGMKSLSLNRKRTFMAMAGCNVLALILGIIASLGASASYGALRFGHWTYGEVELLLQTGEVVTMTTFWGTTARFTQFDCEQFPNRTSCEAFLTQAGFDDRGGKVYARRTIWDEAQSCQQSQAAASRLFVVIEDLHDQWEAECERCKDNRFAAFALIMGVITQLPTIATDFQRMTEFGDVNCQKFVGVMSNYVSFLSNAVALLAHRTSCFSDLATSWEYHGKTYKMEWWLGIGWRCLVLSMFIKLVDGTFHLLVQTPPSRHVPVEITSVTGYLLGDRPSEETVQLSDVAKPVGDTATL